MKKFGLLFASALALLTIISCSDETDIYPGREEKQSEEAYAAQATITSSDANFTANDNGGTIQFKTEGGSVTLTVSCGCDWIAENSATDLFTTSATSSSLTITAEQNTVEEDLVGTITFMTETCRIPFAAVTIIQSAYGAPTITVETAEWTAPAKGNLTTEISVEASEDWAAESGATWLTAEKSGNSLTLTAAENGETTERSTRVTLTCTDGIKTSREYVAVTQDAKVYLTLSTESLSFGTDAGSSTVTVESNFDWDYSYDSSNGWFTVARDGDELTVSVEANRESGEHEGTVTVTAGDGAENVEAVQLIVGQTEYNPIILTYSISSANTSTQLPLSGTVVCTVDWGDGTVEEISTAQPTHTYASAGEYDVVINGTVTALSSRNISTSSNPLPITAVKSWGKTGLTSLNYAFYYCKSLTSLPESTNDSFADVIDCNYLFGECTSLESIPEKLFENAVRDTSFTYAFYDCTSLKEIPKGLFNDCTSAGDLSSVFESCKAITEIPAGLFDNCTRARVFLYAFSGCSGLTTLPDELFKNTIATNFQQAFYNCTSLTDLPSGLFKNCTAATNFYGVFYGCTGLAAIPSGLFDDCTSAERFYFAFRNCSSITAIPTGLFDKCTAATDFSRVFYGCSKLAAVPANLFANCPNVTDYSYAFYNCKALTSFPSEGIFGNPTKVTTYAYVFENCSGLTELPAGLFNNSSSATAFNDAFYGCTALTTLPSEGIFGGCSKATNFKECFRGCSALTALPAGLFDDCVAVTDMSYLCYGDSKLTSIPEGLFDSCTKVTTFHNTFYNCSFKEIPKGFFDHNTEVTDFESVFYFTDITAIPEGLFDSCTKVTTFYDAFYGCTSLVDVPAGLFDNCTSLTNVYAVFYNCHGITSIPTDMFSKNLKITNFTNAFYNCYSVDGESPYTEIEVGGETKRVHLYERGSYTSELGCSAPTSYGGCFKGSTFSDMDSIPSGWGGNGD